MQKLSKENHEFFFFFFDSLQTCLCCFRDKAVKEKRLIFLPLICIF